MAETVTIAGYKIPKNALYIGGLAGAAILLYAYYTRRMGGGSSEETPVDLSGGDPSIDPLTGLPYGDMYGFGTGYTGIGIYDPSTGATIGTGYGQVVDRVSTNAAWVQASIAYLVTVGYEGNTVANALGKALSGQPLTAEELNIFNAARAAQGEPPNNYPPIQMANQQPPGTTNPPPVHAPQNVKVEYATDHTIRLNWDPVPGVKGYTLFKQQQGGPRVRMTSTVYSVYTFGGLKPNTMHTFEIFPLKSNDTFGPGSTIRVRTAKDNRNDWP